MTTDSSAAAHVMVTGLRAMITVNFVPLAGNVAQLDTTSPLWLLELDSGSSTADHCWAMIDVLRVRGVRADEAAIATRHGVRVSSVHPFGVMLARASSGRFGRVTGGPRG
jgi:hypothetical protein